MNLKNYKIKMDEIQSIWNLLEITVGSLQLPLELVLVCWGPAASWLLLAPPGSCPGSAQGVL